MELPCRARGDELLKPGELTDIRKRLRAVAPRHDLTTVIASAFDHRTRMLPFFYVDVRMAPAGARAIGAAMVDSGFPKTRIVLQHWNKSFRPSQMRLDGRIPDIFMVSSMSLHTAQCKALIRDAFRIDPGQRPLIIAGGSVCIYEPWELFNDGGPGAALPDVAVTGEEYVLLSLLEVLLAVRGGNESMRETFVRARDSGALDGIPGLIYARTDQSGVAQELVDTGIQRLAGDLDELPRTAPGFRLLEPPSRSAALASQALPADRVRKYSPVVSFVMTFGCKFRCPYCPIPAYNQRKYRAKSGARIAEEMEELRREYHMRYFFGADDNFFNDRRRALDIAETLARAEYDGHKLHKKIRWGTEVTVHDTLQMKEHLPVIHEAGVRALWVGVEDMTATLVRKGQSIDKTTEAFRLLRANGICPMPMMMHHDSQPLYTRTSPYGLLNQVKVLRKAGAVSLQVLMITPSAGSRQYEETFTSGQVYQSVTGKRVEPYMFDGNFVVASGDKEPWRKQLNILAAYMSFYNPLRFLTVLLGKKDKVGVKPVGIQLIGMWGLAYTIRRTFGWLVRLLLGRIKRRTEPPTSRLPMRGVDGGPASHALPGWSGRDAR